MSGQRFDELTKLAAGGSSSRRSFLKGLVAAAAGTTYGLTAPGNAHAHHEGGERCREPGALCRSNADCCTRYCDSFTSQCTCPPALPDCNAHGDCRDVGENCRANADCCLGLCITETFECACPPQFPNCNAHGNCREAGDNCRSSAECCSGFCDTTGHCAACPPGTELCRGNCIPACSQCQECNQLTGTCAPKSNGTPCDDGNPCTVDDTCQNGVCAGTAKNCDDENPCTTDTCNPSTGACQNTPIQGCIRCGRPGDQPCPKPMDQCKQATCVNGVCVVENRTGTCNDGNPCTLNDTCQNGACVGTPRMCTLPQVCCTTGTNAGKCLLPTGAPCSAKGQCCSGNCSGGVCA